MRKYFRELEEIQRLLGARAAGIKRKGVQIRSTPEKKILQEKMKQEFYARKAQFSENQRRVETLRRLKVQIVTGHLVKKNRKKWRELEGIHEQGLMLDIAEAVIWKLQNASRKQNPFVKRISNEYGISSSEIRSLIDECYEFYQQHLWDLW